MAGQRLRGVSLNPGVVVWRPLCLDATVAGADHGHLDESVLAEREKGVRAGVELCGCVVLEKEVGEVIRERHADRSRE